MEIDVERYYRTYGPMVIRRCRAILQDDEAAADAAQDTFVRLLQHRGTLDGRAPSSLLYTIATNVCFNRLRSAGRNRTDPAGETIDTLAVSDDHSQRILDRVLADTLLADMSEKWRAVAIDHFVHGLTLAETARAHGLSVSGVRKRILGVRTACRRAAAA